MNRDHLAARVARDIPEGSYVNLGIGAPTLVSNHLADSEVVVHTENGMLGMGPEAAGETIDPDLVNAGKLPVTELLGAAYFDQALSFGMIRGGHLDICVLGVFQVSEHGDLANWSTGAADAIPAIGGAMDLAVGARQIWVMTDIITWDGRPKLVRECDYPLTGAGCVDRIYTDRAIFDVTPSGLAVVETFEGVGMDELGRLLGLRLIDARETGSPRDRSRPEARRPHRLDGPAVTNPAR